MTYFDEPKAMAEIRAAREKLSEKLNGMTKEEQMEYHRRTVDDFEKKYGIKLNRIKNEVAQPV